MNQRNPELRFELDSNSIFTDNNANIVYQIMHMEKPWRKYRIPEQQRL